MPIVTATLRLVTAYVAIPHIGDNIRGVTRIAIQDIKSGYWGVGVKAVGIEDIKALLSGGTEK